MEDVMDAPMDIGTSSHQHPQGLHQASNTQYTGLNTNAGTSWPASHARICLHISTVPVLTEMDRLYRQMRAVVAGVPPAREQFKEIAVKVHIRRPERDTWAYMGRGIVTQELTGQSSRVGMHASILYASIRASDMPYIFSRQGPIISQDSDRVRRGASSCLSIVCRTNDLISYRAQPSRRRGVATSSSSAVSKEVESSHGLSM